MTDNMTTFNIAKCAAPFLLGLTIAASSSNALAREGTIEGYPQRSRVQSEALLAQAQAPGRPVTGQPTSGPQQPAVRDPVAPTAPPPPGQPNFPKREPTNPPLTNPLNKK